jgi:glucose-1-phosphate thymidylyltransferase
VVIPPVAVSPGATVRQSVIGPYATIADGVTVEHSIVRNSIVNEGASVRGVLLDASLIGEEAVVTGTFRTLNVGDSSEVQLS